MHCKILTNSDLQQCYFIEDPMTISDSLQRYFSRCLLLLNKLFSYGKRESALEISKRKNMYVMF